MWGISYWILPLFSSMVWLAMLLAMLITWLVDGSPRLPSMDPGQTIAYISDVGAQKLKPLFIAMSAVSVVTLDIVFIAERWLRHRGKLAPNTSWFQKGLSILSIVAAIGGAAGIILLAIFDTWRHPHLHTDFLILFLVGYIVSAIAICIEYQRLGVHHRQHSILRVSFWVKLAFIVVEVALAIAFGVTENKNLPNTSAVIEWVLALVFTFYVFSFFLDFLPVVRSKHHQSRETEFEMADESAASQAGLQEDTFRGAYATNGHPVNGVNGGLANGYSNGRRKSQPNGLASTNF